LAALIRTVPLSSLALFSATLLAAAQPPPSAAVATTMNTYERRIAGDPENLTLSAEYRQLAIAGRFFDRAIDFLGRLARQRGSGPNVRISLALAYVDKAPETGEIRRAYVGRDAMSVLTESIAQRPSVLAYFIRGRINLGYDKFIFHRTDKGIADLQRAVALITEETPLVLVARVYVGLGDAYFKFDDAVRARQAWVEGLARAADDPELHSRLEHDGAALRDLVGTALSPSRRVDTSLVGLVP